jgi:putative glutamine amidotransferase
MRVPIIGVTTAKHPEGHSWYASYADAVRDAGAEPLYLDSENAGSEKLSGIMKELDGLLLSGGVDVYPKHFNSRNEPGDEDRTDDEIVEFYAMECDHDRDSYEIPLSRAAYDRDMPILGICRGFQLLNTVTGGTLVKNIQTREWEHRSQEPVDGIRKSSEHPIEIVKESRLASILPTDLRTVNSRHHQGMTESDLSAHFKAAAFAPDGIVEAIESIDRAWIFAVQWHPERKQDAYIYEPCKALFQAFVKEARDRHS